MQADFTQDEEEALSGLFLNGAAKSFQNGKGLASGSGPGLRLWGMWAHIPSLPQISLLNLGKST